MDKHGNYPKDDVNLKINSILLKHQNNGHSVAIVGFFNDFDFRVLAVIEKPVPEDLIFEFAQKIAESFNATLKVT